MGVLLQHAAEAYALVYFGFLIVVCLMEWAIPLRPQLDSVRLRWLSNVGIAVLNTVVVRTLFPMLGVGWAALCADRGWGLFNNASLPAPLTIAMSVVWFDFLYYLEHVAMHRVPVLWRAHRTHHTDQDFDFSTGLRAHPTEMLLTIAVTFCGIATAGASPVAVLVYHLLTIAFAFLGHANVRLPGKMDRTLRWMVVTPDMHRVHHSIDTREGNSNLSNLFPWWDHLFRTYVDQPATAPLEMSFGARGFDAPKHQALHWMLAQPFLSPDPPTEPRPSVAPAVTADAADPQPSR